MRFREKDTDRVISELVSLMSRYKVLKMCAADWIISRRRRREIFTRLKELVSTSSASTRRARI